MAKSKGNGVASDIISGTTSTLNTDTTTKGAMSSLVKNATSDENTKANENGKSVGGGITFGIKSTLDTDTTAKGAMSSLVKNATSNKIQELIVMVNQLVRVLLMVLMQVSMMTQSRQVYFLVSVVLQIVWLQNLKTLWVFIHHQEYLSQLHHLYLMELL